MERVREFLKKNPLAGWAIVVGIVALAGYLVAGQLFGGSTRARAPVQATAPAPSVATAPTRPGPAPTPTASPAPAAPLPQVPAPANVPSGPTGRADPFIPLVKPQVGGSSVPPPLPPGGALPPPPFPVPPPPPGPGLPPPPLPGEPGTPSVGIAVTGIMGNSHAVAIVNIGGRTEIVAEGETVGDWKVLNIDAVRRMVTFLRDGKRVEVRMGGE